MAGLIIRAFIILVGVGLFLIPILLSNQRDSPGCLLSSWAAALILVLVALWMGSWKTFQCRYTVPSQIKLVGHIKDDSTPRPNHYPVMVYLGEEEIAKDVTRKGKFDADKKDKENDGYFELVINNDYQLTRCSLPIDFQQGRDGFDVLSFGQKSTYLWHNFSELEAGTPVPIKIEEPQKTYTLVVLPRNIDDFPKELAANPTYLDQNGKVTINVPIKIYPEGNPQAENITEFFAHNNPASNSPVVEFEVRDAWVIDGSVIQVSGTTIADEEIIDIDNCTGATPVQTKYKRSSTYIHEVKFQSNAIPNYDLGIVALKASPSLGFTQGQIDTKEAIIDIDVPVRVHRKYKIFWQELWKTGQIQIDLGQQVIQLPFRARAEMNWYPQSFDVACP